MIKYLNEIIECNKDILNGLEIKKINVGFTNLVYSAGNKYIIKICNNKENQKRFENEIYFYLKNKNNKYIPELYNYYISKDKDDYSYEIIEKVNGKSLYFVWHLFDEQKRKEIVKEICLMMKSFHSVKGEKYDWALFIKEKLIKDLNNCNSNNLFTKEEKEKIEYTIEESSKYLESAEFRLVHSDIHFDNVLIDENNNLKLIDFETAIFAPIDYELDIFLRMCNNPLKYSSEETEEYVNVEDYKNIPIYFKEYYTEIFNFEYYEIRHLIYDLEANFRLLARFPENEELKDMVLMVINKIIKKIKESSN